MEQLRPGLLFNDVFGSAGAVTAYHRCGKCFLRKRITPAPTGTGVSRSTSQVHLRALQAWRSLSHEEQLRWEPFACEVEPHRPPFDHLSRISGNNLFISAYHGFATLGDEHVPLPAAFEKFPAFLVKILGASIASGDMQIQLQLETDDPSRRYRLLTKIQLSRPGAGRNPGSMRNYLATGTAPDPYVTATIPNYVAVSGLNLPAYQVHARCILLDTKTGYRSQYLAVSGIVELSAG